MKNVSLWTFTLVSSLVLSACMHHDEVTPRPTWAYPQHLVSLCSEDSVLKVQNRGDFVSWNLANEFNSLLLSMQLVPGEPADHRLFTSVQVNVSSAEGMSVYAEDERGWKLLEHIESSRIHCGEAGELTLEFDPDSYYFWASMGRKSHVAALWTNTQGDLVLQHRWRDSVRGLVGGTATGDAWAVFPGRPGQATPEVLVAAPLHGAVSYSLASCADLSGDYLPTAEMVHPDGSVGERTAVEQFFRKELVGEHPVNQDGRVGTRLRVEQYSDRGITLDLYDSDELLVSRALQASAVRCVDGRWRFHGDTHMESAWLLLAASGGVNREDLTLWRDRHGALLVEGEYVRRALLFLIPFGGTDTLFMAFPLKPSAE